jgi:hypothetical protein
MDDNVPARKPGSGQHMKEKYQGKSEVPGLQRNGRKPGAKSIINVEWMKKLKSIDEELEKDGQYSLLEWAKAHHDTWREKVTIPLLLRAAEYQFKNDNPNATMPGNKSTGVNVSVYIPQNGRDNTPVVDINCTSQGEYEYEDDNEEDQE